MWQFGIREVLRGFGLKVGVVSRGRFAARVRELAVGHPVLQEVAETMLRARDALRIEVNILYRRVLDIVRGDEVCRRLMTVPGVGALTALTFKTAVDDPARFTASKTVGAHFGITHAEQQFALKNSDKVLLR
jgi:transposase